MKAWQIRKFSTNLREWKGESRRRRGKSSCAFSLCLLTLKRGNDVVTYLNGWGWMDSCNHVFVFFFCVPLCYKVSSPASVSQLARLHFFSGIDNEFVLNTHPLFISSPFSNPSQQNPKNEVLLLNNDMPGDCCGMAFRTVKDSLWRHTSHTSFSYEEQFNQFNI